MKRQVFVVFFVFSVSFAGFFELDVEPHSGGSDTEVRCNYSFSDFYGSGYLRFYAIKCDIAHSVQCSFSKNLGKTILFEYDNITFFDGEVSLRLPPLHPWLYRICAKAYNHTNYASDCDSHNYFMLHGEEEVRTVVVREEEPFALSVFGLPDFVYPGSNMYFLVNISNPRDAPKNFTVYSHVYSFDGKEFFPASKGGWTGNRKEIVLPPFSSASFVLSNEIRPEAAPGNHSFKIKFFVDGSEHELKYPLFVREEESGPKPRIVNPKAELLGDVIRLSFEAANPGGSNASLDFVFSTISNISYYRRVLGPKQQSFYSFRFYNSSFLGFFAKLGSNTFSRIYDFSLDNATKLVEDCSHHSERECLPCPACEPSRITSITSNTVSNTIGETIKNVERSYFLVLPVVGLIALAVLLRRV